MKNKMRFALLLAFMAGMIVGWFTVGQVSAYQEKDGGWSASEKRQVIDLLEKIAENTRGN
jgi:hypothetical protein